MHLVIWLSMAAVFQKGTRLNVSVATLALRTDAARYMSTVCHAVYNLIRYVPIPDFNPECPIAVFPR